MSVWVHGSMYVPQDAYGFILESDDRIYNYARAIRHYGALTTEFRDAWMDDECVY